MSEQIQEWYYADHAEAVYGEIQHQHKTFIVGYIIVFVLLAVLGTSITIQEQIYDVFNNPKVVFNNTVQHDDGMYAIVSYKDTQFDPENYIDKTAYQNRYKLLDIYSNVNVNSLGEYEIQYKSENTVKVNYDTLKVIVTDITEPTITLTTTKQQILIRNAHNSDSYLGTLDFDPLEFIEDVSDDYSNKDNILLDYTKNINFGTSGNIEFNVVYTATDEHGNVGQVSLPILTIDDYDKEQIEYENLIKNMELELFDILQNQ